MRLHPLTDFKGALTPYFNCPDSIAQQICKMTYYQFSHYLHQSDPGLVDCHDDLADYTHLLCATSTSPEFIVRKDKLFLEAQDLLKVINHMCVSENNRLFVVVSDEFQKAIMALLQAAGEKEIECTLNLLLSLLAEERQIRKHTSKEEGRRGKKEILKITSEHKGEPRKLLMSRNPKLVHILKALVSRGMSKGIQELCLSVLWNIERSASKGKCTYNLSLSFIYTYL